MLNVSSTKAIIKCDIQQNLTLSSIWQTAASVVHGSEKLWEVAGDMGSGGSGGGRKMMGDGQKNWANNQ